MTEHDEDPWTECIRQQLDQTARDLDAATLSRLNQSRQAALQVAPRPMQQTWVWPVLLATACTLTLAVVIWPYGGSDSVSAPTAATLPDDFTMLAGDEQLDLYQELDFYAWLDAQPQSG